LRDDPGEDVMLAPEDEVQGADIDAPHQDQQGQQVGEAQTGKGVHSLVFKVWIQFSFGHIWLKLRAFLIFCCCYGRVIVH